MALQLQPYDSYETLCARREKPNASFALCHIRWKLFGPIAECVEIADNPWDWESGSRPYMHGDVEDPIAHESLTEPPISSITVGTYDLDNQLDTWNDVHYHHIDFEGTEWAPLAQAKQIPGFRQLGQDDPGRPENWEPEPQTSGDGEHNELIACCGETRPGKPPKVTVHASSRGYVTVGDYVRIVNQWLESIRTDIFWIKGIHDGIPNSPTTTYFVEPCHLDTLWVEVEEDASRRSIADYIRQWHSGRGQRPSRLYPIR